MFSKSFNTCLLNFKNPDNNTKKIDKSYGAVVTTLKEFYNHNDVSTFKNKDDAIRDYIDEAFRYFEERYSDTANIRKPLETSKTIDNANYPLISNKSEIQVFADILTEMRRIINASKGITYATLDGQQVVPKDVAKKELDRQKGIERKTPRNAITKGINKYLLSLLDVRAYMNIMAYNDNESLVMKIYEQLFEAQKQTYKIEQDLGGRLNEYLKKKENKKLVKNLNSKKASIEFGGVKITLAEAISLYMMMKTDNAPSHLMGDGVEFETLNLGEVRRITGAKFKKFRSKEVSDEVAMIESIMNTNFKKGDVLTDEQKQYLQDKFNTDKKSKADLSGRLQELNKQTIEDARNELNKLIGNEYNELIKILEELYSKSGKYYVEASEKMFGMSFAPKKYYYPTKSVKSEIKDVDALTSYVNGTLNPAFTKNTVKGASNALFVGDVITTAQSFVGTLSKYCGVTVEIKNANKLLNAEVREGKNIPPESLANYLSKNVDLYRYM